MPIPPERFKIHDACSYNEVAHSFDFWTQRVTTPLARRVADLAALHPGDRVLDVGAGSGVVTVAAAQQVAPSGMVVGIDLAEGMLEVARGNAKAAGLDKLVQFQQMDAENLQFEDGNFDVAVSLFALRHFPDPARAVREMCRVVKPGGLVVVGIGSGPTLSWTGLRAIVSRFFEAFRIARGRVLVAPEFLHRLVQKHLPCEATHERPGNRNHPAGRIRLRSLFLSAGLEVGGTEWRRYTHRLGSAEEFWDLQASFSSMARKRLALAPAGDVRRIRALFLDKC